MKQLLALLFVTMMLFSLAACGEENNTETDTATATGTSQTSVESVTTNGDLQTTAAVGTTTTTTLGNVAVTTKPTSKACTNADHWALLSKKVLTCSVCGKTTTDATDPNPTKPPVDDNKEICRVTYQLASGYYIMFTVHEKTPTVAEFVSSSGAEHSTPFGDTCSCSMDTSSDGGFTYNATNKTVKCPCGAFTFADPEEFLDLACEHKGATFTILDATQKDYHEKMCDICRNWLYPIREPHTMVGGTCSGCGYTG